MSRDIKLLYFNLVCHISEHPPGHIKVSIMRDKTFIGTTSFEYISRVKEYEKVTKEEIIFDNKRNLWLLVCMTITSSSSYILYILRFVAPDYIVYTQISTQT